MAHCPERTPSRDSSERPRRRFERGRLVRTTRDRIFSLRTSQGDPSRSIRRNFPRLAGRDFFHVLLPRRRRGRDRRARARTPGRRALTPRRCAQDQRPDAPGTRLRHPEPSIPPPPRGELPHARPRVRPKGQFITWRLPGVLAADDAVPRRAARAVIVASPRAPRRRRHHARAPDPRRRPKIHAKPTDRIPPPLPPSP